MIRSYYNSMVRNTLEIIFKKTGFVVKSCYLYTKLDSRNGLNQLDCLILATPVTEEKDDV